MTHGEVQREHAIAEKIIYDALNVAIRNAMDANISCESFVTAVLYHACFALFEQFDQTPDEIGRLAKRTAEACVAMAVTR